MADQPVLPAWWNLDLFLVDVIANNLRDFVRNASGTPAGYSQAEWDDKLTGIATRLEAYKNRFDVDFSAENNIVVDAQNAIRELADVFPMLWD